MGDPTSRTAQLDTGLEDLVRLRMMGIHVPHQTRQRRGRGSERPSRSTLNRVLAGLGLLCGDIVGVHWYTARRPVARVDFRGADSVVLKWLEDSELGTDNESWALSLLGRLPLPVGLEHALPPLLGTSPDGRVQAFQYVGDSATWAQQAAVVSRTDVFGVLGARLAELHGLSVGEHAAAHPDRHVRFPIPSMSRLTPSEYALGYGADFAEYVGAMQSIDPDLTDLRSSWTTSAYIHFDLRDDNVLFGVGQPTVSIIDWELAGFGDPCYDIGTVVGQMLSHRMPTVRATDSASLSRALCAPDQFLAAYQEHSGADEERILRALQFAGVFLLLASLGRLEKVGSLGQIGHLSLLMGTHLVRRPEAARTAMLNSRGTT